jgi:carboxyl-terminal processing protease
MLCHMRNILIRVLVTLVVAFGLALSLVDVRAQSAPEPVPQGGSQPEAAPAPKQASPEPTPIERLLDAVVEKTAATFWSPSSVPEWRKKAEEARPGLLKASSLEEAARGINRLLAELNTSHTGLLTPDDPDYYVFGSVLGRNDTVASVGIYSKRIDGRDFVDLLLEGSPADRAGLKIGDEIVAVDGEPYHPVRSFKGKAGNAAAVSLRRVAEGPIDVVPVWVDDIDPIKAFSAATIASARFIVWENRRIAYVHVWASLNVSISALRGALKRVGFTGHWDQEMLAAPGDLDGLIIDMRGKIGGHLSTVAQYLAIIDPRGPQVVSSAGGSKLRLGTTSMRGRTVLLIDHHTRSAAEIFAHSYKRERLGPIIGSRTAGAVSAAGLYDMPAGYRLYMAVGGLTIDGDVLEGLGVGPDINVERPLAYAGGADPVLDRAVAHLTAKAE